MNILTFHRLRRPQYAFSLVGLTAILIGQQAFAQSELNEQIDMLNMGMGLFGGLALFLFGMEQMADSLKSVAGDSMKELLARLTKNRVTSAITGAFVTAVVQSSSVTTVLVVGFVSAGLMSMTQSVGVIMGANVGTTVTAQIVAFKVEELALLIIALGFAMLFLAKDERVKQYGSMIMGLGLVFFGMGVMSDAMLPLRTYEPFMTLMASMERPLLGIIVGALFTALVQSSSATTGIVIAMASQGLITLPGGIALIFGANVGTCITAGLASFGKPTEAIRAAAVHVFFNVAGVLLWLAFIPQLADMVTALSPAYPELTGAERLAAEVPRQIANAHTVFNIANTFIFILFTTQMARLVERVVKEKPIDEKVIVRPKYLDDVLLDTPALALDRVRMEIGHLGEIVISMLQQIRPAYQSGKHEELDEVAKLDDKVDILHGYIMEYLDKLIGGPLNTEEKELVMKYIRANEDLERIGDVIETELVDIGHSAISEGVIDSETTQHALRELYEQVQSSVANSVTSIMDNDEVAAQTVLNLKSSMNSLIQNALDFQTQRIEEEPSRALSLTRIEGEIIDGFKRIYSLSKRIAKLAVPEEVLREMA